MLGVGLALVLILAGVIMLRSLCMEKACGSCCSQKHAYR